MLLDAIRRSVRSVRNAYNARRARKVIAGTCPECGSIIRYDEHGRDVPPNPFDGDRHRIGIHYRCPNRHNGSLLTEGHSDEHMDLRKWELDEATESEINDHIDSITN